MAVEALKIQPALIRGNCANVNVLAGNAGCQPASPGECKAKTGVRYNSILKFIVP